MIPTQCQAAIGLAAMVFCTQTTLCQCGKRLRFNKLVFENSFLASPYPRPPYRLFSATILLRSHYHFKKRPCSWRIVDWFTRINRNSFGITNGLLFHRFILWALDAGCEYNSCYALPRFLLGQSLLLIEMPCDFFAK